MTLYPGVHYHLCNNMPALGLVPQLLTASQRAFLAAYVNTMSVTRSAEIAGIDRHTHYDWMKQEAYRAAFAEAVKRAGDKLEDEAVRRAVEGWETPRTIAGNRELVREFDSSLLALLLRGAKPDKYRERQQTNEFTININDLSDPEKLSPRQLEAVYEKLGLLQEKKLREIEQLEKQLRVEEGVRQDVHDGVHENADFIDTTATPVESESSAETGDSETPAG